MEVVTASIPNPRELHDRQLMDLLVWDAPNIDMTLSNVIGRKATADVRPRYEAITRWFMFDVGPNRAQASVFTNYTDGTAHLVRPWLEAVRACGFDVFIRPKHRAEDDIDEAMLGHVNRCVKEPGLRRLVVVSGDGRCFRDRLVELDAAGVAITVLGFSEVAAWARQEPVFSFLDIEDIPGAFLQPLTNRLRLEQLPAEGAWMEATRSLRSFAPSAEPESGEPLAAITIDGPVT